MVRGAFKKFASICLALCLGSSSALVLEINELSTSLHLAAYASTSSGPAGHLHDNVAHHHESKNSSHSHRHRHHSNEPEHEHAHFPVEMFSASAAFSEIHQAQASILSPALAHVRSLVNDAVPPSAVLDPSIRPPIA